MHNETELRNRAYPARGPRDARAAATCLAEHALASWEGHFRKISMTTYRSPQNPAQIAALPVLGFRDLGPLRAITRSPIDHAS